MSGEYTGWRKTMQSFTGLRKDFGILKALGIQSGFTGGIHGLSFRMATLVSM